MKIYLLRHGKTEANEKRLYCGSSDIGITENGREELLKKKAEFCYPSIDNLSLFTSGMKRTNETLKLLYGEVPFNALKGFKEIDFGDFELHSYEELKDREEYIKWISGDNNANVCPNGESGNQMTERVLEALDSLLSDGKDALIVSHGGPIASVIMACFNLEKENLYSIQPSAGEGYEIEFIDKKAISYKKIPYER